MKEGQYTKTLAKIQVGEIFTCEISAEILIWIIHRAYGDAMFVPLWVAPTWRQIHLLPSFATNAWIHHSRNSCVTQKVRNWRVLYLKTKSSLRWKLLKMQVQFLVSVTRSESKNSGGSINLYFRYLVKLTSYEMFEVSFWKVLPSHGSLIEKEKKKKKDNIYINTITLFRLSCLTSMGK